MSEQPTPMTAEEQRQLQARQRSRAIITAVLLGGLCVLLFLITIVKISATL